MDGAGGGIDWIAAARVFCTVVAYQGIAELLFGCLAVGFGGGFYKLAPISHFVSRALSILLLLGAERLGRRRPDGRRMLIVYAVAQLVTLWAAPMEVVSTAGRLWLSRSYVPYAAAETILRAALNSAWPIVLLVLLTRARILAELTGGVRDRALPRPPAARPATIGVVSMALGIHVCLSVVGHVLPELVQWRAAVGWMASPAVRWAAPPILVVVGGEAIVLLPPLVVGIVLMVGGVGLCFRRLWAAVLVEITAILGCTINGLWVLFLLVGVVVMGFDPASVRHMDGRMTGLALTFLFGSGVCPLVVAWWIGRRANRRQLVRRREGTKRNQAQ